MRPMANPGVVWRRCVEFQPSGNITQQVSTSRTAALFLLAARIGLTYCENPTAPTYFLALAAMA